MSGMEDATVNLPVMHIAGKPAELSFRYHGELIHLWVQGQDVKGQGQYVTSVPRASLRRWLACTGPRMPLVHNPLTMTWTATEDGDAGVCVEVQWHVAPSWVEIDQVRHLLQLVTF